MIRKTTLMLLGILTLLSPVKSQTITVRDESTNSSLEFVTISNSNGSKQVITDQKGRADISLFSSKDTLILRLLGYSSLSLPPGKITESGQKVFLEPASVTLNEAVISGTRWQEETSDIPSKVSIIHKREIQMQNPQTAADLLATSGSVFVQKSQLGGGSPMIRGFSTNRVLISVDGVRMNNAIFRSGNLQNVISLDPFDIEKTEVQYGPGAVMYGSDAIGGAMNFYTLVPKTSTSGKLFTTGNAVLRYSSANNEKTGHFDINLGFKKWAFITAASYSDFDDLIMGSNGPDKYLRPTYQKTVDGNDSVFINDNPKKQIASGYNQLNIMQKIRYVHNKNWDFQYGFHYSVTSDIPRYDRLIETNSQGNLRDGEWYYGPQKWMMNVLNIRNNSTGKYFNKLNISLAQQFFEESRHNRNFGSSKLNHRTENVDAISLNIDIDKDFNTKSSLFYGTEITGNLVSSVAELENIKTNAVSPLSTRYPDGSTWSSFAAYVNYLYRENKKITYQAGLRYNYFMLSAEFDTTFYPFPFTKAELNSGALTGSAGLAYKPWENWQINANFSTGFRTPNIDDIGKMFDSEPGAVIVPNPDLKSEYAYNFEVGIAKIIRNFIKIDISAYYTLLDNAMVRRTFTLNGEDSIMYDGTMSQVLAIQNAADAYVDGVQAGLEIKLPRGFGINTKFAYQHGEEELDDGTTAPLRHAAPWSGNIHLTYGKRNIRADFYAIYQGEVSYGQLAPSEREKPQLYAIDANGNPYSPDWVTLNFKVKYQLTDYLAINAGIENISDIRYRPYSSGISAPGRNFIISLRAGW